MQLNFPSHSFGPRGAGPQPVVMQGGGSQENKMAKTEHLLTDTATQLKDIKSLLTRQLSSNEEIKKKLTELNRNSIAFNAAKIVDPLHRDLTQISSILERIARATEETAQVAKLSHGLGQSGPVRPSSVVAAARSLDPTSPGGISKKQFNTVLLSATKNTEVYGKETVGLLRKMLNKLQEKTDDIGGIPPWLQDLQQRGMDWKAKGLGILSMIGGFAWNNVIKPHAKQAQLRIQSGFLAKKEEREAKAFEEFNKAIQSGDPKAIERAKAKLKRGRFGGLVDDVIDKVAQLEGKVDPHNLQKFIGRAKEKDQSVPFTRQVAEAIHTGIPLLLSKIIEALNGGEHMWSYGAGALVNKKDYERSNMFMNKINMLDLQNQMKSNAQIFKSIFMPKESNEIYSKTRQEMLKMQQDKMRYSDEVGRTSTWRDTANYIDTKDIAENDRSLHRITMSNTGTLFGTLMSNIGSATLGLGKDLVNGAWRFVLLNSAMGLDNTAAGKYFFEKYLGPTLATHGYNDVHSFTALAQKEGLGLTNILEAIKNGMEDILKGHADMTAPITEAISFFFKIDGNKATPGTMKIVEALEAVAKRFKGNPVGKTAEWLKNNYIKMLRGENKVYNALKKVGSGTQRLPFKVFGEKTQDASFKEAFDKIAKNDPNKLQRLISHLPPEEQEKFMSYAMPGYQEKVSITDKMNELKPKRGRPKEQTMVGLRPLIKLIKEDGMKHRRLFITNNKANTVMRDTLLEIKSLIKEIKDKGISTNSKGNKLDSVKDGIKGIFSKITGLIPGVFKNGFYIKEIVGKIGDSIKSIFTGIKESILKYPRIAMDVIRGAFGKAKDGITGLIGGVRDIFSKGVSGVTGLIGGAKDFITGRWGSLKDRLKGSISGVTDFFRNKLSATKEKIQDKREEIKEKSIKQISKRIDQLYKLISRWFKKQDIKSFFGGIFNGLMGFGKMISSLIGGALSGIMNAIGGIAGALGLGGLAKNLFSAGGKVLSKVPGISKVFSGGAAAAAGGIVAKGGGLLSKLTPAAFTAGGGGAAGAAKGAFKFGKQGLKAVPYVGAIIAAADALYGGYKGYNEAGSIFGLKDGQQATNREKRAGALGGMVGSLGGILDLIPGSGALAKAFGYESIEDLTKAKTAAGAKWMGDKLQNGSRSIRGMFSGNMARNGMINSLVNAGIIEADWEIERINDYDKIKTLSPNQLQAMIDYGIKDPNDLMYVKSVLQEKEQKDIFNKGPKGDNAVEVQAQFDKSTKFDGEVKLANSSVFTQMLNALNNIDYNTSIMSKAFGGSGPANDSHYTTNTNSANNGGDGKLPSTVDNGSEGGSATNSTLAHQDRGPTKHASSAPQASQDPRNNSGLNPTQLNASTASVAGR